jgi:hypothetical protein
MYNVLKKWFASRHLHEIGWEGKDLLQNLVQTHAHAFMEGVLRVAPFAAEITACQSHKGTGTPGPSGLALDTEEDLVHEECVCHGNVLSIGYPKSRNGVTGCGRKRVAEGHVEKTP